MHVIVFFFCKIFDEVNMLTIAHIDGTTCFSTEFMKIFIGKVSVGLHSVKMVFFVFHKNCFHGVALGPAGLILPHSYAP